MQAPELRNFRLERIGQVGVLTFDVPGAPLNLLTRSALSDLQELAGWLRSSALRGLIVQSAKADFCAGADLAEIEMLAPRAGTFPMRAELREAFAPFTRAFRSLETAGVPVASVIDGAAMGGGFEFALATHLRIVTDRPATLLSLPEFGVGLFPAGGGSQRLPRLIGLSAALPILLAERSLSAQEAANLGLAQLAHDRNAAIAVAMDWFATGPVAMQPWDRPNSGQRRFLPVPPLGESAAAAMLSRCLTEGLQGGMDAGNQIEVESLLDLVSRLETWAILRLRFRGRRAWMRLVRNGESAGIEAVRNAVADMACAPWDRAALNRAADAADAAAFGLSADQRAAADFLIVQDLGVPERWGGVLARSEGLWPAKDQADEV